MKRELTYRDRYLLEYREHHKTKLKNRLKKKESCICGKSITYRNLKRHLCTDYHINFMKYLIIY